MVQIPARNDQKEHLDAERADAFLQMLTSIGVEFEGRKIADLGAGFGTIAISLASHGAEVTAVDIDQERLAHVADRAEQAGVTLNTVQANLLQPLVDVQDAELALLIGVIEYAGLWDLARTPEECQQSVLKNVLEILPPGGSLVIGTKNRWWPKFLFSDVHTHQPLVNFMPRALAAWWSQLISGKPYRHHLHSPSAWIGILRDAGFREVYIYYPYFSYQFPLLVVDRINFRTHSEFSRRTDQTNMQRLGIGRCWQAKSWLTSTLNLVGIRTSQSLIVRAIK